MLRRIHTHTNTSVVHGNDETVTRVRRRKGFREIFTTSTFGVVFLAPRLLFFRPFDRRRPAPIFGSTAAPYRSLRPIDRRAQTEWLKSRWTVRTPTACVRPRRKRRPTAAFMKRHFFSTRHLNALMIFAHSPQSVFILDITRRR